MSETKSENPEPQLEAVVGVFDDAVAAKAAASQLRSSELEIHRVSRKDPETSSELPGIVYDPIDDIEPTSAARGMLRGGAIGAGSGLLLLGVPGLNVAAPLVGFLAGTWIGGIAGIDETNRAVELPNREDYREMLTNGKSFVVIGGDEATRTRVGNELQKLGAASVFQHPPLRHVVHPSGA